MYLSHGHRVLPPPCAPPRCIAKTLPVQLWVVVGAVAAFWVEILFQVDAELFPDWLQFLEVLLILGLVLYLLLDACG